MKTNASITRRAALAGGGALALCLALPVVPAHSQVFPTKTITIVVPFPPGGTTDVTARLIAADMAKDLGQSVIVENKPGANGNVGSAQVSKASPDGYTLLMSGVGSNAVNHGIYKSMPYDSRKDFAHVTLATSGPNVMIVNPNFPAKTLKEFVDVVKANPGKYNYASAGNGASGHMAMELLKTATGMQIQHVPYKGGGPALQDVISGHVPVMFTNQDLAIAQAKAGTVRALGVASLERNPAAPEIPTIAEQGFPGFAAVSWNGLSAPAGTPKAVIDILNKAAVKALQSQAVKDKLVVNGFVVEASSPEKYTAFIAAEIDKWSKVAKEAGVSLE